MTSKNDLQTIIDEQCGVIERLQVERDELQRQLRETHNVIEKADDAKPWRVAGEDDYESINDGLNKVSIIRITRDEHGKWEAHQIDGNGDVLDEHGAHPWPPENNDVVGSGSHEFSSAAEIVSATFDEMDALPPDVSRVPTNADYILAGVLSTIWPMSQRHPSESLHLAIYVNDNYAEL